MSEQGTVLAFDIGGTHLRAAEVAQDGRIVWDDEVDAVGDYPRDLELLRGLAKRGSAAVRAAGVACPGPMNRKTGEVLLAANLNWHDVPLKRDLERDLAIEVVMENDADCAALAQATYGDAKGATPLIWYGLGTGVGAGVVIDGAIFHGAFDPEFGHQIMDPSSDQMCSAGHHGCLESLVSGSALPGLMGRRFEVEFSRPLDSLEEVPEAWWGEAVTSHLGCALANAALFFAPETIVLGATVIDKHPELVDLAAEEMLRLLHGFLEQPPRIVRSTLENFGVLGAAAAAWGSLSRRRAAN